MLNDIKKLMKGQMIPLCTLLLMVALVAFGFMMYKEGKLKLPILNKFGIGVEAFSNKELKEKEENKNLVMFFKMKGCPHCDEFQKVWDELESKKGEIPGYELVIYDADKNAEHISDNYPKVKGYPTIMMKNKGKEPVEFKQDRTVEELLKFVKDNKA